MPGALAGLLAAGFFGDDFLARGAGFAAGFLTAAACLPRAAVFAGVAASRRAVCCFLLTGFVAAFLAIGFLAIGFLATAFLGAAFLATTFLATGFPETAFLEAVFLATAFLGAAFLAAALLDAGFLATAFLATAFLGAAFLATGFLAPDLLVAFFPAATLCLDFDATLLLAATLRAPDFPLPLVEGVPFFFGFAPADCFAAEFFAAAL